MNLQFNPQISPQNNFTAKKKFSAKDMEKLSEKVLPSSPTDLSIEAKNYVKQAHNLIEDTWVRIKKKEVNIASPTFIRNLKGREVTLAPIYRNGNRSIVLQINDAKGYERISVDKYAKDFSYEKVIKTEFGSATTKMYDSKVSAKDKNITTLVNILLENYLPKFTKQAPNL